MNKKTTYSISIALIIILFWAIDNFYTPATYSDNSGESALSEFNSDYLPNIRGEQIVTHNHYMLAYSEPHEQAKWVAYVLKKGHLTYDDRKRPYFIEDPKVKSKSADWRNYKNSGYDRGHLCPAGDRRFSEQAYNETFYTSNISPQNRKFNAGIWNELEQKVRYWAKKYGQVYIITGGVLEKGLPEIGSEDVDVPKAFYKIILKENNNNIEALAFLMPNKDSNKNLQSFLVSIDELERITGIDFLAKLSDTVEQKIESKVEITGWKF